MQFAKISSLCLNMLTLIILKYVKKITVLNRIDKIQVQLFDLWRHKQIKGLPKNMQEMF